ncbi:sensor histidine kinase [Microbacterium sp. ZW T5_56]|uniref:sensor histidine kinase n=1 Tax=Microbacterium sp. ZW T5_56 TaxID=3378081 RepID=UPI0038541D32
MTQIDEQLRQWSSNELVDQLFDVSTDGSKLQVSPKASMAVANPPYVVIYGPDGTRYASGGPEGELQPAYWDSITLDQSLNQTGNPLDLSSDDGEPHAFRALMSNVTITVGDAQTMITLVVALPTNQVDASIGTYLSIFLLLAAITVVVAALATRWIVTLAFRRLGQVETTAMAIAAGNFSQRMPGAEPRTEVGRLKLAINTMLGRLDAALAQRDTTVKQMRRFVGDASHELRTPLVTVRGYAELYRMGAIRGEEDTAAAMDRIEKEAIRMGTLVEDLLALARLDERRELVFSAVDLRPIGRDAAMDIRAAAPERTGTFIDATSQQATATPQVALPTDTGETAKRRTPTTTAIMQVGATIGRRLGRRRASDGTELERTPTGELAPLPAITYAAPIIPDAEPIVLGQEDKIRQVVTNLVGNARRYTPDDSPIEIAVGVDDAREFGWIAVIDHGDGIPDELKTQIFERFWRADTSRTRETGGSGLGLSIVASIVEALHGAITVEDTPGGGATFRVSIPLVRQRTPQEHLYVETQPLERLALDANGDPLPPVITPRR